LIRSRSANTQSSIVNRQSQIATCYNFLRGAILWTSKNFASAVLSAVNAGDATDSIGALAGSFVGTLAGVEAIDRQWLTGVENYDVLIGVGENLADLLGRPNSEAASP
jgi:ADP-ribosylglycohydrolase